jgi:hypothetical protein
MWYWKDGKRMGVLNDYDLSSLANVQGPQGNERTGTVPFMARELLTEEGQRGKVKHLYRHDLESLGFACVISREFSCHGDCAASTSGRL